MSIKSYIIQFYLMGRRQIILIQIIVEKIQLALHVENGLIK